MTISRIEKLLVCVSVLLFFASIACILAAMAVPGMACVTLGVLSTIASVCVSNMRGYHAEED